MRINALFWLLPAVICVMAEVWFGVRSLGRDETDPDSYVYMNSGLCWCWGLSARREPLPWGLRLHVRTCWRGRARWWK